MRETRYDAGRTIWYDNYSEYLQAARENAKNVSADRDAYWQGGTYAECLGKAFNGDDSMVADAERIMTQIEAIADETVRREWVSSPCGAYPVVPEAIAGFPTPMRQLSHVASEYAPVSVYVNTVMSGGISHAQIMRRGAAILALVLKLQETRPVNLFVTIEVQVKRTNLRMVIPIDSQPFSVAVACNALMSTGFTRALGYRMAGPKDTVDWPDEYRTVNTSSPRYTPIARGILGLADTDLYIPPMYLEDPLLNDPIKWINDRIKDCNGGEEN